ncbi:MAG: phosphoribosyl-ATP diphosphatase [Rhodospirillaceae bacterium]|nr:phosphoribosyl-ATP diphosphatase [Rhodospirillaceae bacterium]
MIGAEARPDDVIDRLYKVIEGRRTADPAQSYVAKRLQQGTEKIAQKVGEEAVETAIAAVAGKRSEVIAESADLLFHLLILWADAGISPDDVRAELARREGLSGIDEKLKRKAP